MLMCELSAGVGTICSLMFVNFQLLLKFLLMGGFVGLGVAFGLGFACAFGDCILGFRRVVRFASSGKGMPVGCSAFANFFKFCLFWEFGSIGKVHSTLSFWSLVPVEYPPHLKQYMRPL